MVHPAAKANQLDTGVLVSSTMATQINSVSSNLPAHPPTPPTRHHHTLLPLPANPTDRSPPWQPMATHSNLISDDTHPPSQPTNS